jgi:uncharacterized protein YndB with AHSA1/START domain
MTSITLVRRIAARQSIVFAALTTADGVGSWWGTDDLPGLAALFGSASRRSTARSMRLAANTSNWFRRAAWS